MVERTRYTSGTFCWAGLATSDPAAAVAFYTHVFGWEAEPLPAGEAGTYTFCAAPATTSRSVTGRPRRGGRRGGAALDVLHLGRGRRRDHGARRRARRRRGLPGALRRTWRRARIGAALVDDVGALCWNELATTGPGRATSFFGELLGWQYQTTGGGSATIANAGRRHGSIRAQTGQEPGMPPAWLPYFTVGNAEDAARHAGHP